ncbi:MAG: patatin-like phospholipase family protein [Rikenellaceae bacterium]
MYESRKGRRVGVCFSGGAALGLAHVGVIRALEERGIEPQVVSGASMGAIVGALYAQGYGYSDMVEIIAEYKFYNMINFVKPSITLSRGLISHDKVEEALLKLIPHNTFEGLKREFHLSVTDISVPEWSIESRGELVKYILASMSIPMIFNPVVVDGRTLVDGGVMNNLPVEPLVDAGCYIIGADVQNIPPITDDISHSVMAKRYYGAMMNEIQKPRVAQCDKYISFPELSKYEIYDFSSYKELIEIGYKEAIKVL